MAIADDVKSGRKLSLAATTEYDAASLVEDSWKTEEAARGDGNARELAMVGRVTAKEVDKFVEAEAK